ncbi:MAG: IMP dehydrogenase [Spirochaetales bacterium]|nr:IMP dehydrogenase [Spirochaetales bacterium]
MATILPTLSLSLKDFRLLPGFTDETHHVSKVSLETRLSRRGDGYLSIAVPFLSAAMQAVTGVDMAIAIAHLGGAGVLPASRTIEEQCRQLETIKRYKAGFQTDIVTFSGDKKISEVLGVMKKTGYSIFPVTDTGLFHGKLTGVITDKDFDPRYDGDLRVEDIMRKDVQCGVGIDDLKEANKIMIGYGRGFLPIVSREGTLEAVVFKKDLDKHIRHPHATVDEKKRIRVGAAVSTHPEDAERAEELVARGADFLVIDSSDGHTVYQAETISRLKKRFNVPVIAGNVVTREGFRMCAELGADAVKIGMGIGSGCITQEVKATGRGQATAIMEIAEERDAMAASGRYVPLIADGGISSTADIVIALALGADTVMMGNFFARFTESGGKLIRGGNGKTMKEYWMEGSGKAANHRRYGTSAAVFFEEGIAGHLPHAGSIYTKLPGYIARITSALSTAGAVSIRELHEKAVLERISESAKTDSGVHDMTAAAKLCPE